MASFLKDISLIAQSVALYRDAELERANITGYQAKYLLAVFNAEGISQDGLAKRLFINKSNVTRQVGALEDAGYLKRVQSADDRRVMMVYTTEKGKAIIPAIREANARWREIVCAGLSENEKQEMARILAVMVENARAYTEENA